MADGFKIDFTELAKLAADLGDVGPDAGRNVQKAVQVTAHKVRDSWWEPLKSSGTVRGGAASVSYDIKVSRGGIEAEIGPELKGQGPLVGMLEYGTPRTPPTGYGHRALQANEKDFEEGLSKALKDAERGAGL